MGEVSGGGPSELMTGGRVSVSCSTVLPFLSAPATPAPYVMVRGEVSPESRPGRVQHAASVHEFPTSPTGPSSRRGNP